MKKSTILSVLIYLLVAVKTASAQTGLFVPGLAGFDTAVFKLLNNWGLPGGQLAITYHGRLVYNRGFGYADTAAHAPVEANSIFRVASCSKPITSIAIMHLYQQGRIQLTDTVFGPRGILNDTMYQNPLDPRVFDITIYDLLTHSGGWNSAISGDPMFNAYYIATVMGVQPPADSISVIRYTLRYKNLDFTPGTQYQYSNFGFCILGRVIEKLTGQSYTTFVEDSILFPLGLTDMTQGKNLLPQQALNEVHYYDFPGDPLAYSVYDNVTRVPWPYAGFNIQAMDSHGAWVTSASDYCKIICSVDGFNTTPQILSPSTITTMVTPSPTNANYALGWGVSGGTWWHDGSLPGTQTDIVRTSEQVNWALFTNMRTSNYDSLQIALDAVVWNVLPTITSWPNFNLFNPTTAPVAKFGAMVMSQCSGAYQFTDSSINAYTWLWNFGDGTTSYEQNPFHTYGTNGAYSVSLTVANDSGSNTKTISNYITISKPAGPVASSVSSCTPASFSLSVTNSNPVFWYDSASDVVSITNTFTTPMLTATTTYWVEDWNEDSTNYIGPASLAIGGGYYYYFGGTDNYFQLKFKVSKPVILQSVLIYSVTAGNQTVLYTDSGGTIITSRTVYIPVGTSRITLNINLMPGGPYYLGFPNDSFIEYTQTGAAYPYSDPENAVTITGNNFEDEFGSGYTGWYPYFYDWIIAEHYCISERTPVTAEVVHPDTTWLSATICMGNNYNFNGTNLTTSGVYSKNLTASTSCDSTIILTLIVNPSTVGGNASVLISNLCSGSSTSVNLTGYRGTIQWQSSPDNITFTNITGATSSTYTTPALTSTTYYRAAITSGVCASANSTTAIVTINPVSVGGTASAIDNPICSGGSTTINLTGYTGSIQWQSSTDDITFTNITGATSSSYTTPALTSTTYYRAVVTSGVCASTNSTTTTVTINPISVGGTGTATNGTICSGSSTSVNVTGNTGSIQWQSSTDDITFTNITGATSSNYTTPALTLITYYRAEVTNGVCAAINSTTATVTINPVSVGGTATAINGTICTGSSTSINLTGNTGSIQWQTSPDNITFTNIGGATSSSYTTPNLTSITYYRAVVTSGVCDYANSTTATVTINSVSVGGVATATNGTICSGSSTSINLTGDTGNIQWQSSPDNITFTNISGATSSSYTTPSLTSTTYYRAVVTSGVCASANSTTATITVNPASLGGTATATASTLCTGSSTSINLSGNTGSIQWQSSPDNNTFTTIGGAISSSYTTPSLTSTTYYRAVATSGVCASANSTTATVTVDPVSVGGTATATNGTICSGSSTSINLSGNTGSIQWQSSPDNNTFTSIGGATSSSYTTPSLTSTTYYRAVVTSGVCASANSTTATVTVNPVSVGGTATATNGTICSGSSTSINLTGNTGSIQWQSSTNNVTFNNINGAISTTYNTPSLSATTYYRALIISSACATANSTTAVVNINTLSAGGNASAVAVTVCMGSPATVNLTGNSGSIQWQSSADNITFNNINGASSSSYTAPSLAVTTWYRAVVTSGVCVSANSTTATVSVSPLSIAGSANATTPEICSGSSATLSLTGNSGNIQWQSSTDNITFNNITGATAPGYNISVLTSTAYYRAMVTSGVCAATVTDTVVITVDNASAGGTVNAAQDTLCPGNATVLALSGNVGLIQWQSSADNLVYNNIPGATSGTYTTPVLVSTTYYRVASTNDVCPSAYSASNALMVLPATVIQAGPISQVACQGSQVVFNVSASGANLVYQWYKKGNNITGSTAPSYAIDSVSAVDSAVYYVSVAGTCGTAISDTVSLALTGTLQISQQPVSQSLCLGNQVVFSVTVNGVNVHYQWMQNNDTIVNALSSTYSVPAINVSDSGTYVCRISSTCGDISSNLAALSILQPSFNSYNQNWCSGTPYVFNGRNLTTSGTYSDTLQAANSCDSIVTITLTLIPVRHDSVYQTICSGQSYSFNGNHLTTSGSYNDTLPGANGCDSIVTLILTALRVYNTTVSQTICFGQSFVFNQHGCQATGTYPDTLISINNCDSIVTLYLTVLPFSGSTISDTVCADRVYNFGINIRDGLIN